MKTIAFAILLITPAASAQNASAPVANVHYDVTFNSATARSRAVDVAMSFDVSGTNAVLLSLPAWTPGAYEISNFARNVTRFNSTQNGAPLRWDRADHDTWRLRPTGAGRVTVSFRYIADTLDTAKSWTRDDFLMFNGTTVFLYPEGLGFEWPATVTVHTESGWKVGTAMPTAGPDVWQYREGNYHDLVDHPFFVGRIEVDSAEIGGRWMRLVTYPIGSVSGQRRQRIWSSIRAMIPPQVQIFGDVPWPSYNLMQIADPEFRGASGLEHKDSHVNIVLAAAVDNPVLLSLYAHEFLHAWNVKRLRPAELVPYRYDEKQPSPLLWVSEGITDYYADVVLLRAGISEADEFVQATQAKIANIEALPPVSVEDASLSTWINPREVSRYSYYDHGSVAGLLLDILIRDATDNARSLDDVLRDLYNTTYKQGRGFTNEEWWTTVERIAGRSFDEFRTRYIDGRERLPYAAILPLGGVSVTPDTITRPMIGVVTSSDSAGITVIGVDPGGSADSAGVQPGDRLLAVGEVRVTGEEFGQRFRQAYRSAPAGTPLRIRVSRNGREHTLDAALQTASTITYDLGIEPQPTQKARRIREGIFSGRRTAD